MRIEAVTVCVGYADFLEHCVENRNHLDRWIIVTSEDDHATQHLCRKHNLECIRTSDYLRDDGGSRVGFNKGRMIERGLMMLSNGAWRLHLDGDIKLPHNFRSLLSSANLNTSKIYGCDRVMVRSFEQWEDAKSSGALSHSWSNINMPRGMDVGSRWALPGTGYVPIGFFQLWHSDGDEQYGQRYRTYPISHGDACRTDVQFASQWDRNKRELIPEIVVVHLESEAAELGANWKGRTTKPFGPDPKKQDTKPVSCS